MNDYPRPLEWPYRAAGMPLLKGGNEAQLVVLRAVLEAVEQGRTSDEELFPTGTEGSPIQIGRSCVPLRAAGLVASNGRGGWAISDEARRWLETGDHLYLIAVLHARVRFIGELLAELGSGKTHGELNEIARTSYLLPWSTLDQVRRRTAWLRAAGLVELRFDNRIIVTEVGAQFLSSIECASPLVDSLLDELVEAPPELPELGSWVQDALDSLTQESLVARKPSIGYIPGPAEDVVSNVRVLVTAASPSVSRDDFAELCARRFSLKSSSVASVLTMLRRANLVEPSGVDTLSATQAAQQWIADGSEIELVLWLHTRFAFILELVAALDVGERPRELAVIARSSYGIPREDVGDIRRRLHFLRAAGLVKETSIGRHQPTPLGRALVAAVAVQQPAGSEPTRAPLRPAAVPADPPGLSVLTNLRLTSRDSAHPDRFERAVAAALRVLGVHTEWIGGSGHTDVLLRALCVPNHSYTVIVDAKSSGSGNVEEGQVNFDTLKEHKLQHQADYAAVIGPAFRGERLNRRAADHGVLLLPIDDLETVLANHLARPLPLSSYKLLFSQAGLPDLSHLESAWQSQTRACRLIERVLYQLGTEATSADPVTKGALSVSDLYLVLRSEMDTPPTPDELAQVLDFLASPLVCAIAKFQDRYALTEDPATTSLRLQAYAQSARGASLLEEFERADRLD